MPSEGLDAVERLRTEAAAEARSVIPQLPRIAFHLHPPLRRGLMQSDGRVASRRRSSAPEMCAAPLLLISHHISSAFLAFACLAHRESSLYQSECSVCVIVTPILRCASRARRESGEPPRFFSQASWLLRAHRHAVEQRIDDRNRAVEREFGQTGSISSSFAAPHPAGSSAFAATAAAPASSSSSARPSTSVSVGAGGLDRSMRLEHLDGQGGGDGKRDLSSDDEQRESRLH